MQTAAAMLPTALVGLMVTLAGCAGYRFGNQTLYRPDVQTVHVPIFESDSFRRGISEWLTEAVIKEIELKTPYRVVPAAEADSVLLGRILADHKRVVIEDPNDIPRALETSWVVEVRWQNPSGNLLANAATFPLPTAPMLISDRSTLIPEAGQSTVSSQERVVKQLAEQIVAQMEAAW